MGDRTPSRNEVLGLLWKRTQWLDGVIEKLEKGDLRASPKLHLEVYVAQVFQQNCKTVLFGLKDTELDALMRDIQEIKEKVGIKSKW